MKPSCSKWVSLMSLCLGWIGAIQAGNIINKFNGSNFAGRIVINNNCNIPALSSPIRAPWVSRLVSYLSSLLRFRCLITPRKSQTPFGTSLYS